ncbi:aminopeptidase P N-terminal domain-containing protein [Microvirga sp. STS02]|uniref:aminopeptidase P N-terminal domain-containing protein n=1 Tax=Hymenobacter negativus TaxID=2795026 RepID=UPI0018DEAB75|nr:MULTISPECIES: aminopeptidase P N-terminal domain-containing protein [Bacteria]MBH8568288.1 aminopeptidase P N-terminal domain-containing protein [Hymenobacter negativus]MBR7208023.1 aminopeptidase P N-terminal domain-containing protein [Microvirga sp. STS02]
MSFRFSSCFPSPRLRPCASSVAFAGLLGLLSFAAAAQAPVSIPEPLNSNPAPARPTDFLSPAFHKQRRELLRAQMPANSVAVLFAAPVRNRANDVDYIYHQNPDFHYLTGYEEPNAVLLLFKEPRTVGGQPGVTEALFTQPRDPRRESWTGRRLGAAGAKGQLQLQYAADNKDFEAAGIKWNDFDKVLFDGLPTDARDDAENPADLFSLVNTFRQQAGLVNNYNPTVSDAENMTRRYGLRNGKEAAGYLGEAVKKNPALATSPLLKDFLAATTDAARKAAIEAHPPGRLDDTTLGEKLGDLRAIKTPEELALLRRAIRISAQGQREVLKLLRPDMGEMDVQGLHEYVYRRYGAEFQGYPSIVGGGANGCILHYETNDRQRLDNDLVLMDCGAEYHGYSADVTRTAPPSGTFSPAQRQIYELVLAAQEAGFTACRPGADFNAPNKATQEVVAAGLVKLGIIKKKEEFRKYYPHGASHYLGLDVHDSGSYGPLMPGNVITVEPGIYIPAGSPCDPKWWNIGVRIEDDALITATGYENLSAEAPRTVADIEKLMAEPSALEGFKLPELK